MMNNENTHFNIKDYPDLESFPHVVQKLQWFWGTEEIYKYFEQLMINDRGEARQGFPLSVVTALTELKLIHEQIVPSPIAKDIWSGG